MIIDYVGNEINLIYRDENNNRVVDRKPFDPYFYVRADEKVPRQLVTRGKFGENNYKLNILKGFLYLSLDEEEWLEVMAFMLGRGCTAFRGGRRPAPIHKLESRSAGLPTHARVVLRNWVILTARVFVGTHVPAEVPAEDFTGAFVYAVRASLLATPEMDGLTLIDEVWYTEYKTKMRKIVVKMLHT